MEATAESNDILVLLSTQSADAIEQVARSVVLVDGRERQAASGIVFEPDLILTAAHVLEVENPEVETADGRRVKSKLVGLDRATDLAVLRAEGLAVEPPTLAQGAPRVGEYVLAVGRPASGSPMASSGVISSVGGPARTREGALLEKFLTTDARPYPGFSGGPLVNLTGEVLGVMTSGLLGSTAIAIPGQVAWRTAKALAEHGTVRRGYLGIGSQQVDLQGRQLGGRTQETGLLVVHVEDDGPASKAGVLVGDILLGLDGNAVLDADALLALLSGDRVGKTIQLDVLRGEQVLSFPATIAERT
jgi:S1-C subfamily serine protease